MDAGLAKLCRILALIAAMALMIFGLFVAGLGPPSPGSDVAYAVIRLSAIGLALVLMWLAGWLRSQEALDPTGDGRISSSVLRHFALYLVISIGVTLLIAVIVLR